MKNMAIRSTDERVTGRYQTRSRRISFLRSSPSLAGIQDILEICLCERYFSVLCRKCRIAHKATFLKYLKWCMDHHMLEKEPDGPRMTYRITPKGRRFLQDTSDNE